MAVKKSILFDKRRNNCGMSICGFLKPHIANKSSFPNATCHGISKKKFNDEHLRIQFITLFTLESYLVIAL